MGYSRENYSKIKHEYDGKNLRAKDEALKRTELLHAKIPELREIDAALSETGMRFLYESMRGKENLSERIEKLREENAEMQKMRAECLKYHGYDENYTAPVYECPICADTGFVGLKMCVCMKRALVMAGYESSGIGELMKTQSFDTFSLDYYKEDAKNYENMKYILNFCKKYASGFELSSDGKGDVPAPHSLLLCGQTGLGKTHLSTSVAKVIIDRGFDVVYETAQNLMSDFEYERFGRGYNDAASEVKTDRYFECDLLIIDDLGTEMINQFTISCLYNIINTRLTRRRPMIINTNLTQTELRSRYADRITSRLFGEFLPLLFGGKDIRAQNLRSKKRQ